MRRVRQMGRKLALLFAVVVCSSSFAADVTVPSTYDEATDTWIGNFVALTNAMKNQVAGQTIYLSKGVYDLTPLAADRAPMSKHWIGHSLLTLNSNNLKLVGASGDPKDVLIKAENSDYRLLVMNNSGTQLRNVTMMGGFANTNGTTTAGYHAGGAVMIVSGGVISNCVFTGNKAKTRGGAVSGPNSLSGSGTVYDSVFYGNDNDKGGSLAAAYVTMRNCIITNNHYTGSANDGAATSYCHLYDSLIADNSGNIAGGAYGGIAVNSTFLRNRQIYKESANNWNGGGGGAREVVLTNCTFWGNVAYRLGGAVFGGDSRKKMVNCIVASNATQRLSNDAYAGGIYSATVLNCTVVSNVSVNGGGVSHCTVFGGTNAYNRAKEGGGANSSALTDCYIAHNVATTYVGMDPGSAGGGMRYGAATNCVFRDNSSSVSYLASKLVNCDIADTLINARHLDSCVIHDVQSDEMRRAIGNVSYPNGIVTSNAFMLIDVREMRNCLITNCTWKNLKGTYVNAAVFESANPMTGRVDNCTFIDNYYYLLTRHFSAANKTMAFSNCVFLGNKHPDLVGDVVSSESAYLVLSNCVYGKLGSCTAKAAGYTNYGCTSITERAAYKFTGKGPNPYSLKRSSPLRGWGMVLDWMADGTDMVGNPRLRDGAVDIGCYQCWLDPIGAVFSIR